VEREPLRLVGESTVPAPVAASEIWVILYPPLFHPLTTAASVRAGWSVAPEVGKVIATCEELMAMAADETATALTGAPALASLPDAPDVATKLPPDCAVKGTWKIALPPPAMVVAPGDAAP